MRQLLRVLVLCMCGLYIWIGRRRFFCFLLLGPFFFVFVSDFLLKFPGCDSSFVSVSVPFCSPSDGESVFESSELSSWSSSVFSVKFFHSSSFFYSFLALFLFSWGCFPAPLPMVFRRSPSSRCLLTPPLFLV